MAPRILHVDDSEDMRMVVMLALETVGGLDVAQCGSGADALRVAVEFKPDLFLFDVMMPEMTGPETLMNFRQMPQFAATPVVFMTAKAQPEDRVTLMALGALEVITKPFDPMTVSDQLVKIYEKFQAAAAAKE